MDTLPTSAILSAEAERISETLMYLQQTLLSPNAGTWLPFDTVSRVTGLHPVLLRKLVRDGVIHGEAPYRTKTVTGQCDLDAARRIAGQLATARQAVEGNPITAADAELKYGFARQLIGQWHQREWVNVISNDGITLFNEGDIAFAAALAKITGNKQGKPLLPSKE